jgi:hypothetical protein
MRYGTTLFEAKQAAEYRTPPEEVFAYVWAPDPQDPRYRLHAQACGRIVGNTLHDDAT